MFIPPTPNFHVAAKFTTAVTNITYLQQITSQPINLRTGQLNHQIKALELLSIDLHYSFVLEQTQSDRERAEPNSADSDIICILLDDRLLHSISIRKFIS